MQFTTFSPSSSSSRRSTPCVLGCCGPMLSSIVSPVSARGETNPLRSSTVPCHVSSTGLSTISSSFVRSFVAIAQSLFRIRLQAVDVLVVERELHRLIAKRVIFAQWISFPVFWHQDTAQVGVPLEHNAHHVEGFTFLPVRGKPHARYRRQLVVFAGQIGFQTDSASLGVPH